jgi:AcrR family transcriptional regulator
MMAQGASGGDEYGQPARGRGRPRRHIALDSIAEAVSELFHEGGYEAVTISNAAEKLAVPRATLYRTVPTKEKLMGVLFEREAAELTRSLEQIAHDARLDARQRLHGLIRLQAAAAVRMRRYMPVFFGGEGLDPGVYQWWRPFSRRYEAMWVAAVEEAMAAGVLRKDDPVVAARLLLGMLTWVSPWYRPNRDPTSDAIAEVAINLLYSSAGDRPSGKVPAARRPPRRARRS